MIADNIYKPLVKMKEFYEKVIITYIAVVNSRQSEIELNMASIYLYTYTTNPATCLTRTLFRA